MKKFLVLVSIVAVMISTACNNQQKADMKKETKKDTTLPSGIRIVSTLPTKDTTKEEKFALEIISNDLKLGQWKDSTLETSEEDRTHYQLPVKLLHGSTKNFVFVAITCNKYYEESKKEEKRFDVIFKSRFPTPEESIMEKNNGWEDIGFIKSQFFNAFLPREEYPKRYVVKAEKK